MGLRTKLNLLLLVVGALGAGLFAAVSYDKLTDLAKQEVEEKARIMMAIAKGVRDYTADKVKDCFEDKMNFEEKRKKDKLTFYPQAVSAYAAQKTFEYANKNLPDKREFKDYNYRELALNPTKREDTAEGMDRKIIEDFRSDPSKQYSTTYDSGVTGQVMKFSAHLQATEPCLDCHGTPEKAPKALRTQYGSENGFRWQLNEIIGAQIVTVPIQLAHDRAIALLYYFLLVYLGVLAVLGVVLNLGLASIVTGPVLKMSRIAEDVSRDRPDTEEFDVRGSDEIALLAQSFTRMRRSLEAAKRLLSSQQRD
jgi:HAMP domain-containing protein